MVNMDSDNEESQLVIDETEIDIPEPSTSPGESYRVKEGITSTETSGNAKKIYSPSIKKYSDEDINENENFHPKKRRKCFSCSKCHKKFSILDGLNNHKKLYEDGKLECSECKHKSISSEDMQGNTHIYINSKLNCADKISRKSKDLLESHKLRRKLPPLFRIKSKSPIATSDLNGYVEHTEKEVSTLKKHENEYKKSEKSIKKSSNYFKENDSETPSQSEKIHSAISSKRPCETDIQINNVHVSESDEEGDIDISISGDSGISSESGDSELCDKLKFRDSSISSLNLKQIRINGDSSTRNIRETSNISSKVRKNNEYKEGLEKCYKFKKSWKIASLDGNSSENNVNKSYKSSTSDEIYSNNISDMKLPHTVNNIKSEDIEEYKPMKVESCNKINESSLCTNVSDIIGKQDPDFPLVKVVDNATKIDGTKICQNPGPVREICEWRPIVKVKSPVNNSNIPPKELYIENSNLKIVNTESNQTNIVKKLGEKKFISQDCPDSVQSSKSPNPSFKGKNKLDSSFNSIHPINIEHHSLSDVKKQELGKPNKISYEINQPISNHSRVLEKVNIRDKYEKGINDSSTRVYINSSTGSPNKESGDKDDVQYIFMNYIIDGKSTKTRLAQIPQTIQSKGLHGEQNSNEQPLNLSMQNSNSSSQAESAVKTFISVEIPKLNEKKENLTLNTDEIYNQNKFIYISNTDLEDKNKMSLYEDVSSKDIGSPPPLYEINDTNQAHLTQEMDLPPLSQLNSDKRGHKKSMHRKRIPLYAQPEPDDPEERNRWHRARVTEKNRRERNKEAVRVENQRDILKSEVHEKDALINELRAKLANTEANNSLLQGRNNELEKKLVTINAELERKQERINGQWILFQELIKKKAMTM